MGGGQKKGKSQMEPPATAARRGEEEEEEEQMEEFFGLLRSIQEMKDQRRLGVGGCGPRKKARGGGPRPTGWTPAFEWEDFGAEDDAPSRKRRAAGAPIPPEEDGGGEGKEGKADRSRSTFDLNHLPL